MRSLQSIARKKAKARARFKDYTRRRNINANVPTVEFTEKVPRFRQVYIESAGRKVPIYTDKRPKLEHDGYKDVVMKVKQHINHTPGDPADYDRDEYGRNVGMILYPKRRKWYQMKETKNA